MRHDLVNDLGQPDSPRFLVVEDQAIIAMYLEDILVGLKYQAVKAARLRDAAALLDRHRIDGAFLDVNISGAPVYPLVDELHLRGIPFAFITGHSVDRLPAEYRNCLVLTKPIVEGKFAQLVKTFAAHARAKSDGARGSEMQALPTA